MDVSGSMRAKDVEPTRLDAAVAAMNSFLDKLPQPYQVGLVQFNATPADRHAADPRDARTCGRRSSTSARRAARRSATAWRSRRALVQRSVAEQPGAAGKDAPRGAIILLSDGTQSSGRLQPGAGAALAQRAGIPVYTVALGTNGPKAVVPGPGTC